MMLQLGGQTHSREPLTDRLERLVERLPLLHFCLRAQLTALVVGVVFCCHSEAFAHISAQSPYKNVVVEKEWAAISNAVFFLGQLLGWAYLTVVLHAQRRRPFWKSFGLAFLFQAGVTVVLFFTGVISFLMGMSFTHEFHIIASGFEIFSIVKPTHVAHLLLANTVTFSIGWGLIALLLLIVRGMRRRWLVALFHALVVHPFAFPVGILLGLMHVLYVWQIAAEKQPG